MEPNKSDDYSSECYRYSLGRAKISLSNLAFEDEGAPGQRRLDKKKVERLVEAYDREGCLRYDPKHFLAAVIDDRILETAVYATGIFRDSLFAAGDPPQLFLGNDQVVCLHGKHRVAAAREYFVAEEWWVVDLYSTALSEGARASVREEVSCASEFSHGDIYRNWCYYKSKGLELEAERWMARLSPALRGDLRRLDKNKAYRPFCNALKALLPFHGLWPAWYLGIIRRMLKMKCPDECASYLRTIKETLQLILGYDKSLYQFTDYDTIVRIQTRNPARNEFDRMSVDEGMRKGELFCRIRDSSTREQIRLRLVSVDKHIPSLHTFHEDTKWLDPAVEGLRCLFSRVKGPSLKAAISSRFRATSHLVVPNSADEPVLYHGSRKALLALAYMDMFTFAWRNFPRMSSQKPRVAKATKPGKCSISSASYNHVVINQFRERASKLGFCLDAAPVQSADERMIDNFLNEVRPLAFFSIDSLRKRTIVKDIAALIKVYEPVSAKVAPIDRRLETSFSKRCGRPFDNQFEAVGHLFWLENLLGDDQQSSNAPLQLHKDTFRAFFGDEILACQDSYAGWSNLGGSVQRDQAPQPTYESPGSTGSFSEPIFLPTDTLSSPGCSIYGTPREMICSPSDHDMEQ